MTDQALSDVKVVDLTQHVAGPYCTKLFADFGAEVIKIEKPNGGDVARRLGPFPGDVPHPEKSGLFLHLNTNKKSVTLNLTTATGKKILRELVKDADVLVENYAPQTSQALGITYAEMEKINPRLLMVSITNFGQFGPYRDYKATDMLIYAAGGLLYVTGDGPDREPAKIANYAPLYYGGNAAAALTMAAFYGARYHGLGQHVDISLMEQIAGSMDRGGPQLLGVAYSGTVMMQRADVVRTSILPPAQALPSEDGYVWPNLNMGMWPKFLQVLGRSDLATDPDYSGINLYNMERTPEIDAIILGYTMERRKQEIMEAAQGLGVAVTAIKTVAEAFHDPHLRERGYFVETEHPVAGEFEALGAPFKMSKTPWQAGRAPLLGEHNLEILCDRLGYSKQDLALLRSQGVI